MRPRRLPFFLNPPAAAYGDDQGNAYYGRPTIPVGCAGRLLIAVAIAAFALFQYWHAPKEKNAFTGREQRLNDLDPQTEVQMGLASAPQMTAQYGGESPDASARSYVSRIGQKIVDSTAAGRTPYRFQFHLLANQEVVNAFALPGGQVFITEGLFRRLNSEDEIAGVLGHEIGHVVGRHSAEQIVQTTLVDGLTRAAIVAVNNGQGSGYDAARLAQMANQLVNLRYSRADENEADMLGVHFLAEAGYDPEAMIRVMQVLQKLASGSHQPEIMSTHPDPGNRIEHIRAEIEKMRSGK
jgi:predicted Zn-dependent protease